jgi:hypothetical protein
VRSGDGVRPDGLRRRGRWQHASASDSDSNPVADSDAHADSDADPDADSHADPDADSHADAYSNAYADTDADVDLQHDGISTVELFGHRECADRL